jgi:SAM-dependent methyltransferase
MDHHDMNAGALADAWTRIIAPRTGDVRSTLVEEAAEFLGIPIEDAWARAAGAGERFRAAWHRSVTDTTDVAALTRFYNESDVELFELIEWHATDPIHYRTLILRDAAVARGGHRYLDYGSGIGNDALVFGEAGCSVTLADISDCLLGFAAWRCRRRGLPTRTIDLKREGLPPNAFDVAVCFDVLEHIPRPLRVVRAIRRSLGPGGMFAMHAPFGRDPEHPMHVVHRDVVTPRMRSLGFRPLACAFPPLVRAPRVYERGHIPAVERLAYFVYDSYLNNAIGASVAAVYRRSIRGGRAPASQAERP